MRVVPPAYGPCRLPPALDQVGGGAEAHERGRPDHREWKTIRPPRPSSTSDVRLAPACLSAMIAPDRPIHHAMLPTLAKTPASPTIGEVRMPLTASATP